MTKKPTRLTRGFTPRLRSLKGAAKNGSDAQHYLGPTEFDISFAQFLNQEITTNFNGKPKTMSVYDLTYNSLLKSATEGNSVSLRYLLTRLERAAHLKAEHDQMRADNWRTYRAAKYHEIAKAEERGETPPETYPHPDDIIIDHLNQVSIIGPIDEAEARKLNETIALRDLLVFQSEYDDRQGVNTDENGDLCPSGAMVTAMVLDHCLPPRMQWDIQQIDILDLQARRHSKRELEKLLFQGYRSLGSNVKRGTVLPNRQVMQENLTTLMALLNPLLNGEKSITTMTDQELKLHVQQMIAESQSQN